MIKAQIKSVPYRQMDGKELRRLRNLSGMSQEELGRKLGTYRKDIQRKEDSVFFDLPADEMQKLLDILGATTL